MSSVWGDRELSRLFWKLNKSKDREKILKKKCRIMNVGIANMNLIVWSNTEGFRNLV
jgi:hypothetical protein